MAINPTWLSNQIKELREEIKDIKAILVAVSKSETKEKKETK
jgi:spore maturation protein CgeB